MLLNYLIDDKKLILYLCDENVQIDLESEFIGIFQKRHEIADKQSFFFGHDRSTYFHNGMAIGFSYELRMTSYVNLKKVEYYKHMLNMISLIENPSERTEKLAAFTQSSFQFMYLLLFAICQVRQCMTKIVTTTDRESFKLSLVITDMELEYLWNSEQNTQKGIEVQNMLYLT